VAFTRTWLQSALRISVVTLLVPICVLVAILATELGSGFGGIGSLRELVSGPAVPIQQVAPLSTPARGFRYPATLPVIPVAGAAPPIVPPLYVRTPPHAPPAHRGTTRPPQRGHPTSPSRPRPPRRPTGPGVRPPAGGGGGSTTPVGPGGGVAPAPAPNPIRQLGQSVQGVVSAVPVVGPGASNVVGTLINILAPPTVRAGAQAFAQSVAAPFASPASPSAPATAPASTPAVAGAAASRSTGSAAGP
jgi:hypothetical protein